MVPGCWEAQIAEPFGIVHAWYWRDIEVPAAWADDREAFLRFEAVMYRCEAWLNGKLIGEHEGGYTPFEIALGDLRRGAPNRIAVLVTNPMNAIDEYPAFSDDSLARAEARVPDFPIREIPHGKQTWYGSQSGLWRSVRLESRPRRRLERIRAAADWASGSVAVRVSTIGVERWTDRAHGARLVGGRGCPIVDPRRVRCCVRAPGTGTPAMGPAGTQPLSAGRPAPCGRRTRRSGRDPFRLSRDPDGGRPSATERHAAPAPRRAGPGHLRGDDLHPAEPRDARSAGPTGPGDGSEPPALPHQDARSGIPGRRRRGGHAAVVRAPQLAEPHAGVGSTSTRPPHRDGRGGR